MRKADWYPVQARSALPTTTSFELRYLLVPIDFVLHCTRVSRILILVVVVAVNLHQGTLSVSTKYFVSDLRPRLARFDLLIDFVPQRN
jgi:hypothetical protein